jgi:hypothetical protein
MLGAKQGGFMLTAYLYRDEGQRSLLHRINSNETLDETIRLIQRTIADHLPAARSYQIENGDGDVLAVGVPGNAWAARATRRALRT